MREATSPPNRLSHRWRSLPSCTLIRQRSGRAHCEPLEQRTLLAAITWDGGGDGESWTDPANWSSDTLPRARDVVLIGADASVSVGGAGQRVNVKRLESDGNLTLLGGSIRARRGMNIAGSLTLEGSTTLRAKTTLRLSGTVEGDDHSFLLIAPNVTVTESAELQDLERMRIQAPRELWFAGRAIAEVLTLDGRGTARTVVTGILDASTSHRRDPIGRIDILGADIYLHDARLDVCGKSGAGSIRIGGDLGGAGDFPRAQRVLIDTDTRILADAGRIGSGGRVIIWSDVHTIFNGTISASGGRRGGDGGFIETSAKATLHVGSGSASARSPHGKSGRWLMDPYNVTIGPGNNDNAVEIPGDPITFLLLGSNAFINVAAVEAGLNSGTDVTVTTVGAGSQAGTLTLAAPILKDSGGDATLTLQAADDLLLNESISASAGRLHLVLQANTGPDDLNPLSGSVSIASALQTNGGSVSISGISASLDVFGFIASGDGDVEVTTTDTITLEGTIAAGTGTLTLNSASGDIAADTSLSGGSIEIAAPLGSIQVTQAVSTGPLTLAAGVNLVLGASFGGLFSAQIVMQASAGALGSGNLTFGNAVVVHADTLVLRAGDDTGHNGTTSFVDVISGNPMFGNSAGDSLPPFSFAIRQDATLLDAALPGPGSFSGGEMPAVLSYQSDDGDIEIRTPANILQVDLHLHTASNLLLGAAAETFRPRTITFGQSPSMIQLGGDIATTGGNLVLPADVQVFANPTSISSSGDVTFLQRLDGSLMVNVSAPGTASFEGDVGSQLPLQSFNVSGNTVVMGDVTAAIIRFNSPTSAQDDLTITATGSGPFFESSFDAGSGQVLVRGDNPDFLGGTDSVSGSGTLRITASVAAADIRISDIAFLSVEDVAAIAPGFAAVEFGSLAHLGPIIINPSVFKNHTTILNGTGDITQGAITVEGGGGLTLNTTLGLIVHMGPITTSGGPILINAPIYLEIGIATFDTTNNSMFEAGGDITFTDDINGAFGEITTDRLELFVGESGTAEMQGMVAPYDTIINFNIIGGADAIARFWGDVFIGVDIGGTFLCEPTLEVAADITIYADNAVVESAIRSFGAPHDLTIFGYGVAEFGGPIDLRSVDLSFQQDDIRLGGPITVDNTSRLDGNVILTSALAITAEFIEFTGTINLAGLDLSLIADGLALADTVSGGVGASTLEIAPRDPTTEVSVNHSDNGLYLSTTTLSRLADGLALLVIGSSSGESTLFIGSAQFTDPVEFRMAGPGGEIIIDGYLRGIDNASFTFFGSGSTITINDYITTRSQPIVFNDAVEIGIFGDGPVLISTTNGATPGAPITFNQTLDSVAGQANGLDLEAGVGDITFNGEVGGRPGGELGYLYFDIGPGQTRLNGGLIRSVFEQTHYRTIVLGGDSVIETGTATLYLYSQIICGEHDLLLRADDIEIFDLIIGTGNLQISPFSFDRPMDVNISRIGPGDSLTIDPAENDKVMDGFESVTYGQEGQMSDLSVGGGDYSDPTIFVANGEGEGSSVVITGEIRGTDNGGIRIRGGGSTTHLFGSIRTQGNFIIIEDSVIIHSPGLMLDSTDGGAFPQGNEVEVQGMVDSEMDEGNGFVFQSGLAQLRLMGAIGTRIGGRLGFMTIASLGQAVLTGGLIKTIGFQLYNGPVLIPIDLTLSTLNAPITFEDEVLGESNLTIDDGSGETTFEQESHFASLTIDFGSTRTFNAPVTIGTLTILGGTVFFNAPGLITDGRLVAGILSGTDNASFDGQFAWEGGSIEGSGLLIILPGGVFEIDTGAQRTLSRNIQIRGRLHWAAGNLHLDLATLEVTPEGVLEVTSSGTVTAAPGSSGALVNDGRIERNTPGAGAFVGIDIQNNGEIDVADGAIKFTPASGTFTNDGLIAIGPSGSIIIRGEFVQFTGATLLIRIAGTGTAEFGRLMVINSAALDGTITTEFVNGFNPQSGDEFRFLTAETRTGTFTNQNIEQPPGNLTATIQYTADGVSLVIAPLLTVDYNNDGEHTVEDIFAFLAAWFAGEADFDGDGQTTVADIFAYLSAWFAA